MRKIDMTWDKSKICVQIEKEGFVWMLIVGSLRFNRKIQKKRFSISPYDHHIPDNANRANPRRKFLRKIKVKNLTFNIEKPRMLYAQSCRHYYCA